MSHRLEKNTDTKYHDYKEPKMSRHLSAGDYKRRQENTRSDIQSEDAESTWNIARESESNKNRGSFANEQQSVENITKQNKKSLGSSVASEIRKGKRTEETMLGSVSNPKEET
ncbi:hypothetical protein Ngar_c11960 [Candidatus Nitrososphaera gargensis Ga9.2]|uniref:Uncharacterized protein n=1 Tax=Nitrososphaera gargensis (strain Ga9.2) TaxID=1237085 RepID=K0I9Y2_NITGG|nr:hypothetical protein [Candidatus Nitrososphaera gargensis]AFU58136.1 hypothetical protein Ngar_c11960 [Candidatus Nitrososphaera gargensis Ga9.2]